jgi:hypothetical protein
VDGLVRVGRGLVLRCRLAALAAAASLGTLGAACVDDNIPERPLVDSSSDGGDAAPVDDGGVVGDGSGPIVLASAPTCAGMKLVVFAGVVYWTDEAAGTVNSVPATGGRTTVIATGQTSPGAIAVDATWIFWVAENRTVIRKKPLVGGTASVFIPATATPVNLGDENDINALLVANNTLYFGRYIFASKIPTDGTTPLAIMESPDTDKGRPGAFALDAIHLYQVELVHFAVSRETLDGKQNGLLEGTGMSRGPLAPDRIAVSQGSLLMDAIAVLDDDVYWANGPSIYSKVVDQDEHVSPTTVTSTVGSNFVTGFVVSGGDVYFGESVENAVERASLDTGIPNIIATDQKDPGQFAADATNIYWRTSDCKIVKLAK